MPWIDEEIRDRGGAVSFRDFMELALYHPRHGYYSSPDPRYGRPGDFLTAPSASRWYARVLAATLRRACDRVGPVALVDVGSGDGSLLGAVVDGLGDDAALVLSDVVGVESSRAMRLRQEERLQGLAVQVRRLACVSDLGRVEGPAVIHASELYDALPVHRVAMDDHGLHELWVACGGGGLQWQQRPARVELRDYFERHQVALARGQMAEVNLGAAPLHGCLLERAGGAALVLTLDYGYPAGRLYDPRARWAGSLACYRHHRLGRDPLAHPGDQDITAHINWDDLLAAGREAGFREVGLWPLAEFLVRAGLQKVMDRSGVGAAAELDASTFSERQEIKRLLDPDGMGSDLRVLIQARGGLSDSAAEILGGP